MVGNKIADKITSKGKLKKKEKTKKLKEIYIPLEKRQQIIDDLKLFLKVKMSLLCTRMEFKKTVNLFDTTFDDKILPRLVTRKWIEVYDQSGKNCSVNKEIRIKISILRWDLCDFSDVYLATGLEPRTT